MTVDHRLIYQSQADDYERLVAAEDRDGRLAAALRALGPWDGTSVVEVGAGTGRLTRLLRALGGHVVATEPSGAMIAVGRRVCPVTWIQADARALPVADGWADAAMAGWVIGHFTEWRAGEWRDLAEAAVREMEGSVRPGGRLVIFETLGTGTPVPAPPSPGLAAFYEWLGAHGFEQETLRTDYEFADVAEAVRLTSWFFGPELGSKVQARASAIVPECTAMFTRAVR